MCSTTTDDITWLWNFGGGGKNAFGTGMCKALALAASCNPIAKRASFITLTLTQDDKKNYSYHRCVYNEPCVREAHSFNLISAEPALIYKILFVLYIIQFLICQGYWRGVLKIGSLFRAIARLWQVFSSVWDIFPSIGHWTCNKGIKIDQHEMPRSERENDRRLIKVSGKILKRSLTLTGWWQRKEKPRCKPIWKQSLRRYLNKNISWTYVRMNWGIDQIHTGMWWLIIISHLLILITSKVP